MKLSILIPCFNEEATLKTLILRVLEAVHSLDAEVLVVDDASTDGTAAILAQFETLKVIRHSTNAGKGAAVRTGLNEASGEFVLIQDADLEYNPADYPRLLSPIFEFDVDVVYGSRFQLQSTTTSQYWSFWLGNQFLTWLANRLSGFELTDMETCYKVFRRDLVDPSALKELGFGLEPELTMRFARIQGLKLIEVPISYSGRTIEQGKKIKWLDGLKAIFQLFYYRFMS